MTDDDPNLLRYKLSDHNAGRSCSVCDEPADMYYFLEKEISTFRCVRHLLKQKELPDDENLENRA